MTSRLKGLGHYLLIIGLVYAGLVVAFIALRPLHANFENFLFDEYQRLRPRVRVQDLVRTVEIDDESIRRYGQWPWPRQILAQLVDKLASAHAAAICFDILFSETERSSEGAVQGAGDVALTKAIAGRPVVLGALATNEAGDRVSPSLAGFAVIGDNPAAFVPQTTAILSPIKSLVANAGGVGFVNWRPDADRVVRNVPLLYVVNNHWIASLALETLRVAQGASTYAIKAAGGDRDVSLGSSRGVAAIKVGDVVVPTQADGAIRAYFAVNEPRLAIPAWKALDSASDLSDFNGKIVVIGASAAMLADLVATPLNPSTPGVEAEAQVIEQLIDGVALLRPDWAYGAELLAATLVSAALAVAVPATSVMASALLGAGAVALMAAAAWFAFVLGGLLLDPVSPSLLSGLLFLTAALAVYSQKRRQLSQMQALFGRFVSSAIVERLAERPEAAQLGGAQRVLTLMFCDLRSFTTISEGLSAVELTSLLNEYLTPMTNCVLKQTGTVDKYMGDAIMAFWNAPLDDPNHAAHAVAAALEMRATLSELNRGWEERAVRSGGPFRRLRFGIGLNTGECCVGNLGSTLRFDYSAIGDEVNVASRLEGSCKFFNVDIVASEATRARTANFAWLEIDSVLLKNKAKPVAVFALAGDPAFAASPAFIELAALNARMLAAYRERAFSAARALAKEARALAPEAIAGLYDFHERRFGAHLAQDVAPDWRPLVVLEEK
jgi:adenylate cyclase